MSNNKKYEKMAKNSGSTRSRASQANGAQAYFQQFKETADTARQAINRIIQKGEAQTNEDSDLVVNTLSVFGSSFDEALKSVEKLEGNALESGNRKEYEKIRTVRDKIQEYYKDTISKINSRQQPR